MILRPHALLSGLPLALVLASSLALVGCKQEDICDDGIDNDSDALIDCDDSDCSDDAACASVDCTDGVDCPEDCTDGVDNDGDGKVDEDDSDCDEECTDGVDCPEDCSDGVDNDGDGLVDGDDSDCAECGDSTADACVLTFEEDSNGINIIQMDETIGQAGDRDWFAFDTEPGVQYQLLALGYYVTGNTTPDTVLRLYNSAGELIATNDDMPTRFQNTDSGLAFEALDAGPYYAEVLDWSDWDPTSTGADGGSEFVYSIFGYRLDDYGDFDPEPENDDVGTLATYIDDGNYVFYGEFYSDYANFFKGNADSDTDNDFYSVTFSADSEGALYSWAMWPGPQPAGSPEWRLWDENMNLIGETGSPMYDLTGYYYYDYGTFYYGDGIVQRVKAQTYYLEIVDGGGRYGTGTAYAGMFFGFVPEVADIEDEKGSTAIGLGQDITFDESTTVSGLYFGRFTGELAGSSDELDSWKIDADSCGGSLNGKYLNVYVAAEDFGSLLDPKVTIYDGDAVTVLTSETTNAFDGGADPVVADFDMTGVSSNAFIVVEAQSDSGNAYGNSYFVSVTVSDDFQH